MMSDDNNILPDYLYSDEEVEAIVRRMGNLSQEYADTRIGLHFGLGREGISTIRIRHTITGTQIHNIIETAQKYGYSLDYIFLGKAVRSQAEEKHDEELLIDTIGATINAVGRYSKEKGQQPAFDEVLRAVADFFLSNRGKGTIDRKKIEDSMDRSIRLMLVS